MDPVLKVTFLFPHETRGLKANHAMGVLPFFDGMLCHDHWKAYFPVIAARTSLPDLNLTVPAHLNQYPTQSSAPEYSTENRVEAVYAQHPDKPIRPKWDSSHEWYNSDLFQAQAEKIDKADHNPPQHTQITPGVFGYGNLSRGDDALGPLLIEYIEKHVYFSGLEIITDFQLQIEHALEHLSLINQSPLLIKLRNNSHK
jgi:hypothetical protein